MFKRKTNRKPNSRTQRQDRAKRASRTMAVDSLEKREMMSVSAIWFSGSRLVVKADNLDTHVVVSKSGSNLLVDERGSSRSWTYRLSKVGDVEFQGGNGDDKFVSRVSGMSVRAFGGGGKDHLQGYNGNDILVGGSGDDTLIGSSGHDRIWGESGHDTISGGSGNDRLSGGSGRDEIDGGSGNDILWGGSNHDTLLGGSGDDQLVGDSGNDHLNGQSGKDKLWGGTGSDSLVAIDAVYGEYVDGGSGADGLWIDQSGKSRDNVVGVKSNDEVHRISRFTNTTDRTLNGDRISDPAVLKGHTYKRFTGNPLFSTSGPRLTDVGQGVLGDCYALAGLGAIASDDPNAIRQNIVDFNDGTYGVRLGNKFYRIDNDLPVVNRNDSRPAYAALGAQNSMWVAIAEKAFAHYRKGKNSYASIEGGWSKEINKAFRSSSVGSKSIRGYRNRTDLVNDLERRVKDNQAVTIGFDGSSKKKTAAGGAPLILGHMYVVHSFVKNSAGKITSVKLYNPWGSDGAGNDGKDDGFVTVTAAQLWANPGQVNWGKV